MFNNIGAPKRRARAKARAYLASLIIALPVVVSAAPSSNHSLSLQQAIKNTLDNNPELKVFQYRQAALEGLVNTAQLSPALELNVSADNVAGSDEYSGTDQAEWTVSLSSTLELGGKQKARVALANSGLGRLEAQLQVQALATLGDVTRSYIQVLAAQERLALAQSSYAISQQTLTQVKSRAKAGAAPKAEVLRAQAARDHAKLKLAAQQQMLGALKVALAAQWGDTQVDFNQVNGSLYEFGQDSQFAALLEQLKQNPALEVFAAQARLQKAQLRLTQTQARGDIGWSLGVKQFQQSNSTALVAGLSMPLFSGSRNSGALQTAHAQLDEASAKQDAALLRLRTQLYQAYSNRQQAIYTANTLAKNVVPTLTKALKETRKAYESGRYRYLDYVSAQQDLLSAQGALIDAAASALTFGAEIEQLSAQPLSLKAAHFSELKG
jgi:cobalt-zinc-cadmium efflux system outer membrane protein